MCKTTNDNGIDSERHTWRIWLERFGYRLCGAEKEAWLKSLSTLSRSQGPL